MGADQELKAPTILKVVCFFIPLVGLIIYACNISKNKNYANSCGIASLVGLLLPIVIAVIVIVSGAIYSNSLKNDSVFTSGQGISVEEQNEIKSVEGYMEQAKLELLNSYHNGNEQNVHYVIKTIFFKNNYNVTNSANISSENGKIIGYMTVRSQKGNNYMVDFSNNIVTKK
ncbi:MAG: hypothetical protein HFJ29_04480 [Clostridia bacterium]|nr:hypothetical protein [Clostridia bacterium]